MSEPKERDKVIKREKRQKERVIEAGASTVDAPASIRTADLGPKAECPPRVRLLPRCARVSKDQHLVGPFEVHLNGLQPWSLRGVA